MAPIEPLDLSALIGGKQSAFARALAAGLICWAVAALLFRSAPWFTSGPFLAGLIGFNSYAWFRASRASAAAAVVERQARAGGTVAIVAWSLQPSQFWTFGGNPVVIAISDGRFWVDGWSCGTEMVRVEANATSWFRPGTDLNVAGYRMRLSFVDQSDPARWWDTMVSQRMAGVISAALEANTAPYLWNPADRGPSA